MEKLTFFQRGEQGFIGLLSGNQTFIFSLGGGSCNFQPSFGGGSVIFVSRVRGGSCVFYRPHFQMKRKEKNAFESKKCEVFKKS